MNNAATNEQYLDAFGFLERIIQELEKKKKVSSPIWQDFISTSLFSLIQDADKLQAIGKLQEALQLLVKIETQLKHLIPYKKAYIHLVDSVANLMATIYKEVGNLPKASSCLKNAIDIAENLNEYDYFPVTCLNYSKMLNLMGNYREASIFAQEAAMKTLSEIEQLRKIKPGKGTKEYRQEIQSKEVFLGNAYFFIGKQEQSLNNLENAMEYFEKAKLRLENNAEVSAEVKKKIINSQQETKIKLNSSSKLSGKLNNPSQKKKIKSKLMNLTICQGKHNISKNRVNSISIVHRKYANSKCCNREKNNASSIEKEESVSSRCISKCSTRAKKVNFTNAFYIRKDQKSAPYRKTFCGIAPHVSDVNLYGYATEHSMYEKQQPSSNNKAKKGMGAELISGSIEEQAMLKNLGALKWSESNKKKVKTPVSKCKNPLEVIGSPQQLKGGDNAKQKTFWSTNSHAIQNIQICQENINNKIINIDLNNEDKKNTEKVPAKNDEQKKYLQKIENKSAIKIQNAYKRYRLKIKLINNKKANNICIISRGVYKTGDNKSFVYCLFLDESGILKLSFYDTNIKKNISTTQLQCKNEDMQKAKEKWEFLLKESKGNISEDCEKLSDLISKNDMKTKISEVTQNKDLDKHEKSAIKLQNFYKKYRKRIKNKKNDIILRTFIKLNNIQDQNRFDQYVFLIFRKNGTELSIEAIGCPSRIKYNSNFIISSNAENGLFPKIISSVYNINNFLYSSLLILRKAYKQF